MTLIEILMVVNSPALVGIFVYIFKVEKRLTTIETVCKLRNEKRIPEGACHGA